MANSKDPGQLDFDDDGSPDTWAGARVDLQEAFGEEGSERPTSGLRRDPRQRRWLIGAVAGSAVLTTVLLVAFSSRGDAKGEATADVADDTQLPAAPEQEPAAGDAEQAGEFDDADQVDPVRPPAAPTRAVASRGGAPSRAAAAPAPAAKPGPTAPAKAPPKPAAAPSKSAAKPSASEPAPKPAQPDDAGAPFNLAPPEDAVDGAAADLPDVSGWEDAASEDAAAEPEPSSEPSSEAPPPGADAEQSARGDTAPLPAPDASPA